MRLSWLAVLLLTELAMSCAALGTRSHFSAGYQPAEIKRIALVTRRVPFPVRGLTRYVDSLLILELNDQLTSRLNVQVTYVGEADAVSQKFADLVPASQYDAVLYAEPALRAYGIIPYRAGNFPCDVWIQLKLVKVGHPDLLAESRFNTAMGNSYLMPPRLHVALHDAAVGSVTPFVKRQARTKG